MPARMTQAGCAVRPRVIPVVMQRSRPYSPRAPDAPAPTGFMTKKGRPGIRTRRVKDAQRSSREAPKAVAAPPEALLGYRLWQVHYAWHRHIERHLEAVKLTHLQYVLLAATSHLLNDRQPPTQIGLAKFTRLEKMMVSKNLRALERQGLIARHPHPQNSRANEIGLTARGWRVLGEAFAAAAAAHGSFFRPFGKEWRRFDAMLRILMPGDARDL
jgi:DNA-binding MarR family transcriptional regulator